jgi:chromosome segregation ATPase
MGEGMAASSKKIPSTKPQTRKNSDAMSSLHTKLKSADPEIQHYLSALEKKNFKLEEQISKLQAENTSLNNRIIITQNNLKECCVHGKAPYECLQKALENIDNQIEKYENKSKD